MPSPRSVATSCRRALVARLGIDARALAATRIAVGALLLADLGMRAGDIAAHYTDAGALPRHVLAASHPLYAAVSLHALSGALWFQAALFVLAAAAAAALLLGHRTRLATVVSLILLASLHARNPLVLNGGDSLLRRTLLWGALLPMGRRWSVDAARGRSTGGDRVVGVASAGLLLQVVAVYLVNALIKLRGESWPAGQAVATVFGLEHLTLFLGDVLARHPALTTALTLSWLALLLVSPLLVVFRHHGRTLLASMFVAAHLGMLATIWIGLFPLISIAVLLPFYPAPVWDRVEAMLPDAAAGIGDRFRAAGSAPGRPVPSVVRRGGASVARALAAALLAAVLVWNAAALGYVDVSDASPVDPRDRRWSMFAPEPLSTSVWYVAPARTVDGDRVDALHRVDGRFERPDDLRAAYPSYRWSRYARNLAEADAELQVAFADYLCRRWNATATVPLRTVTVVAIEEPAHTGTGSDDRRRLARVDCADQTG